jgi:chromosome segregation ATPase
MEYGSFQNLRLSQLDFEPGESKTENLKHEVAIRARSTTVATSFDALMSQNEDLSARLKVALRRLTEVETESNSISEENNDLRSAYFSQQDQILIWKEKEKVWKNKEVELEEELRKVNFQSQINQDSLNEKKADLIKLKSEIDRHKRYHEKIQKTVKPYVQQLKDFTLTLQSENKEIRAQNEMLLSQVRILESKIHTLNQRHLTECETLNSEKNKLIEIFENERSSLKEDLKTQKTEIEGLQQIANRVDRLLERNDELENLVVVLRRTKEELEKSYSSESESIRNSLIDAKNAARELELKYNDIKSHKENLQSEVAQITQQLISANEQMTSLRYLWTQKAEENEKLKVAVSSLEKINFELSEKLNQLRSL